MASIDLIGQGEDPPASLADEIEAEWYEPKKVEAEVSGNE